jgi:pimeloyl-ACP methyl ester carboxylesterase
MAKGAGDFQTHGGPLKLVKRFILFALLIIALAGVGFWLRPISYINGLLYAHETLSGVRSRQVIVDGHRIHYELASPPADPPTAPVVVLVHGLGGRAEDWRNLAPFLAQAGFRVYMPDLVGYGRSEKPVDFSYSIHDEASLVVDFMNVLGLEKVDLGGWSMGGAIAQHVAYDHPERIERLILFDSAGLFQLPTWDTRLFTPTAPVDLEQLDVLLMPHPPQVPAFIVRDLIRTSNERAWVIHRALASMLTGKDATDNLLPQLKMPVLIVWGAEDHITPIAQGKAIHQLVRNSQLEVIPNCGHLAPDQCAAQIAPSVLGFLKQ